MPKKFRKRSDVLGKQVEKLHLMPGDALVVYDNITMDALRKLDIPDLARFGIPIVFAGTRGFEQLHFHEIEYMYHQALKAREIVREGITHAKKVSLSPQENQ